MIMNGITKKIADIKGTLRKILESPIESTTIKAQVAQQISMDEHAIRAMMENKDSGDIYIVQAAQINAQTIKHSAVALQQVDELNQLIRDGIGNLEEELGKLLNQGWKEPEILDRVKKFNRAWVRDKVKTKKAQANRLGLKESTYKMQLGRNG